MNLPTICPTVRRDVLRLPELWLPSHCCCLLDEPAAGMNPQETLELDHLIKQISLDGQAILLIEHDMQLVMSLSDRIFVMDYGKKIAQGTSAGNSGKSSGYQGLSW